MKRKAILVIIMLTLISFATPCFNYECFAKTYSSDNAKSYTLKGKIKKVSYYHVNGQKLKGYRLCLSKKIKIKSSFWGGTMKVKQVQIIPKTKKQENKIKKYLGKKIKIKGNLIDGFNAWYIDQFAIINAKIIK
jgi:hypothetical protein